MLSSSPSPLISSHCRLIWSPPSPSLVFTVGCLRPSSSSPAVADSKYVLLRLWLPSALRHPLALPLNSVLPSPFLSAMLPLYSPLLAGGQFALPLRSALLPLALCLCALFSPLAPCLCALLSSPSPFAPPSSAAGSPCLYALHCSPLHHAFALCSSPPQALHLCSAPPSRLPLCFALLSPLVGSRLALPIRFALLPLGPCLCALPPSHLPLCFALLSPSSTVDSPCLCALLCSPSCLVFALCFSPLAPTSLLCAALLPLRSPPSPVAGSRPAFVLCSAAPCALPLRYALPLLTVSSSCSSSDLKLIRMWKKLEQF